ncbi:MAG: carboxypeptidase regulatory-like domain-containing protein [Variovorax sp.]
MNAPQQRSRIGYFSARQSMHRYLSMRRVALFLALALGAAAMAALPGPMPGGFLNGGVGEEEQQAMQAERQKYNLRMTFASAGSGEFLAGIPVTIEGIDRAGEFGPYPDSGPLLWVRLEPGSYRVRATYEGNVQVKTVRIGKGAVELVFYWPGATPRAER